MKVFVQGATGVLGRRLVRDFAAAGFEVVGLARSEEGAAKVKAAGGTPAKADVFDAASLARAAEGAEVVVRAATHIPHDLRVGPEGWAENARLRTDGTRALLDACTRVGAKVFLQESIVWVARPPDGTPFNEDSPVLTDPISAAMVEAERMGREAAGRMTSTTLRLGNFFAPEAWHTRYIGERVKAHKFPVIGDGAAEIAIVNVDDASAAFVKAAEVRQSGLFHVIDDRPAPLKELLPDVAQAIGARPPGRAPKWIVRLVAGRAAFEFFTTPMRTTNARFKQATGWSPRYPTHKETIAQIVGEWRKEGFLVGGQ